jgi:hypothetical protein
MAHEYRCPECGESFTEGSWEGIIKRAHAHAHEHHGVPESLTPEIEKALAASTREL